MADTKRGQQTAVVPVTPQAVVQVPPGAVVGDVLDAFPQDQFNRVIPTSVVMAQANPFVVPMVAAVALQINVQGQGRDQKIGGDAYRLPDFQPGEVALSKTGLGRIANVAGVQVVEQWRSDDRSDPDLAEVTTRVAMTMPTGQVITALGIKSQNVRTMKTKPGPEGDAHRARLRATLVEMAATKSHLRAIRALLNLPGTLPLEQARKPWAVVHYVPNMQDPRVQERMLLAIGPAQDSLYGSRGQAAALDGGLSVQTVPQIEAPQAPDDEPPHPAGTVTVADGRQVDAATGEVVDGGTMFDGDVPAAAQPTLLDRLATRAGYFHGLKERDGISMIGPATDDQKHRLQDILGALGVDAVGIVVFRAFDRTDLRLTAGQAAAILEASASDGFEDDWRATAQRLNAAQ